MIEVIVHSSGIEGEPLHLPGQGGLDCRTCHPVGFPATLDFGTHSHQDLVVTLDIDGDNIKMLDKRLGVVEQILSDMIPPQPGEPGYDASSASPTTEGEK